MSDTKSPQEKAAHLLQQAADTTRELSGVIYDQEKTADETPLTQLTLDISALEEVASVK